MIDRREFIKRSVVTSLLAYPPLSAEAIDTVEMPAARKAPGRAAQQIGFDTANWESLNPGYWRRTAEGLRRNLNTVGHKARRTGFPFHYETHLVEDPDTPEGVMDVTYDPSLPLGMMWNRQWMMTGSYTLTLRGSVRRTTPPPGEDERAEWKKFQPGHGLIGVAIGGRTQFDSFHPHENAPWMAVWDNSAAFGLCRHTDWALETVGANGTTATPRIQNGDAFEIRVAVEAMGDDRSEVRAVLVVNGQDRHAVRAISDRPSAETEGYFGLVSRGALDVEVHAVTLEPGENEADQAPQNACHSCYPLGDTLQRVDGAWTVTFVALFRSDGEATLKISDDPDPDGGWASLPVAGRGAIVSNDFRDHTAIIEATLPYDPSERTMYFTVWKDGENVTGDPRIGTDACGPGTGMVGDVPAGGDYVGRLPQLTAPYRLCGLSCHAINENNTTLPHSGPGEGFYVHDQPCYGAFEHIEDYDFQILLWEDDIWYLELLLYPPSTQDAYKIITTTLCGPTTRWKMMRHWNVLNPGDHDHGMDDVKGPEQIIIRNEDDVGQDPEYMARNFQIVSHLMTGAETPSGTDNPKRWRRWKMPNRDFTLLVMDSRLWRSSQDTRIWDDQGWGHKEDVYARTDPTRALLGEEQFAWLQETLRTDSANLICLTGLNGLHTVWKGQPYGRPKPWPDFAPWDRVAADYAGWVAAGADRVLDLLGGRTGVSTVYGDVHNGSILKNKEHNVYECSFGPIGRHGGRMVVDGFGTDMEDHDGRPVQAIALYHEDYGDVQLTPRDGPPYWNFLEMEFHPMQRVPSIRFAIRNIVDGPTDPVRGGAAVTTDVRSTGRPGQSMLPPIQTLPDADVQFLRFSGEPIRGCHSLPDGRLPRIVFPEVAPGEDVLMVVYKEGETGSQVLTTTSV
jgi:hypothetical protein